MKKFVLAFIAILAFAKLASATPLHCVQEPAVPDNSYAVDISNDNVATVSKSTLVGEQKLSTVPCVSDHYPIHPGTWHMILSCDTQTIGGYIVDVSIEPYGQEMVADISTLTADGRVFVAQTTCKYVSN